MALYGACVAVNSTCTVIDGVTQPTQPIKLPPALARGKPPFLACRAHSQRLPSQQLTQAGHCELTRLGHEHLPVRLIKSERHLVNSLKIRHTLKPFRLSARARRPARESCWQFSLQPNELNYSSIQHPTTLSNKRDATAK